MTETLKNSSKKTHFCSNSPNISHSYFLICYFYLSLLCFSLLISTLLGIVNEWNFANMYTVQTPVSRVKRVCNETIKRHKLINGKLWFKYTCGMAAGKGGSPLRKLCQKLLHFTKKKQVKFTYQRWWWYIYQQNDKIVDGHMRISLFTCFGVYIVIILCKRAHVVLITRFKLRCRFFKRWWLFSCSTPLNRLK